MKESDQRQVAQPTISIDISRDARGRIKWNEIIQEPGKAEMVIESMAGIFVEQGENLTHRNLRNAEMSYLSVAITKYYPGGMFGLKTKFGMENHKKPDGYWEKGPELFEARAIILLDEGIKLGDDSSRKAGMSGFLSAVRQHYPGGLNGLKEKMGIGVETNPKNYWTPENVEREARDFFDQYGELSTVAFTRQERLDLQVAISRRYSGGLAALKEMLGIETTRKPEGYWTPNVIEEGASKFFQETGKLSFGELKKAQKGQLWGAISQNYPGGMTALKAKLGIVETMKPPNYWKNIENIVSEAMEFYLVYGNLTHTLLWRNAGNGLAQAITKYYPGGMDRLKIDLGITEADFKQAINPDQANEQLAKLVEAAK